MGVYEDWQRIYGGKFGYSDAYRRRLYEQGEKDIGDQYAGIQKERTADVAERGFYSARPMQRMGLQVGTAKARALQEFQTGIRQRSEELAERQKGQLFGATAQETMQAKQQEYALSRMDRQQQYTVLNMSSQQRHELSMMNARFQHDRDMAQLRKDLESKGWGHLLGAIAGGVVGSFFGAAGAAAGAKLGESLF